jgi:TetR/AcrR family transcriptional regulator, cholesterol catabolism regulator
MSSNKNREIKQNEILEAAAKLFLEKGFEPTTIKEISEAAGINQAMIYYYFPDKQELLFEVMCSSQKVILNKGKRIANLKISPELKLEHLIKEHIKEISAVKPISQDELRNLTPKQRRIFIAIRDKYENIFRKLISEAIKQGKIRDVDVKLVTIFTLTLMNSILRWYKSDGKYSINEITAHLLDYIKSGIISVSDS